ncbi:MAG: DUF488 family protein [Nitrospiraceae bacterium]|nr:DUF488 family protein [Nitrospiraceae bacterium]
MVIIKRVYAPASRGDGRRILVDRLWPRGLKKEDSGIDEWLKEIAPTTGLRKWYSHEPAKWPEFRKRYEQELLPKEEMLQRLRSESGKETITLLCAARDVEHSNAAVLRDLVLKTANLKQGHPGRKKSVTSGG